MKFVETQSPYPAIANKTVLIILGLAPPHAINAMNAARNRRNDAIDAIASLVAPVPQTPSTQ